MGWCHRGARAFHSGPTAAPLEKPFGLGDTEEGPVELLNLAPHPCPSATTRPPTLSSLAEPKAPLSHPFRCTCPPPHLTLAAETPLLQPGPDALDAAGMLRVLTVVSTGTLVLQHHGVVDQPCRNQRSAGTRIPGRLLPWLRMENSPHPQSQACMHSLLPRTTEFPFQPFC